MKIGLGSPFNKLLTLNFLAHFVLSYPAPDLIAGNFVTDFLNHKEQVKLDNKLQRGVEMHQWIDTYTDQHINISKLNKFFHPAIHHYAPVATDIVMDYFLYRNWNAYLDAEYNEFKQYTYQALGRFEDLYPEKVKLIVQRMIQNDFLQQYQSLEGINDVMLRMNKKAKFDVDFTLVIPLLSKHHAEMNLLFIDFFEEARKAALDWLQGK